MFSLEIIAVLSTLLCVILTYKENILCWPLGIVGIIAYLGIFYLNDLKAEAALQVVFLFQSIYGWYNWGADDDLVITRTTINRFLFDILDYIGVVLMLYYWCDIEFLDAFTAMFSILATKYLVQKKLQAWIVWIVVDYFMIILFIEKNLYLSAVFYTLLLCIALRGFYNWKKNLYY